MPEPQHRDRHWRVVKKCRAHAAQEEPGQQDDGYEPEDAPPAEGKPFQCEKRESATEPEEKRHDEDGAVDGRKREKAMVDIAEGGIEEIGGEQCDVEGR